MNELERLREEARKTRAKVTGKIGRIRRNTGVEIKGTREDPRKNPSEVKYMNRPQLRRYLNDLNSFLARDNQYIPGAGNAPIPRRAWHEYKTLEARYNAIGRAHDEKVGSAFIPTAGMTIKEYQATIHPKAQGEFSNRPYSQIERSATQIPSREALEKLTKDMRRKTTKRYLSSEIKKSREQMMSMLDAIGHSEYAQRAKKLSNSQFDILWNYTNMARLLSLIYELLKLRSADSNGKERWHDRVVEDSENELGELFSFGENQPTNIDKAGS